MLSKPISFDSKSYSAPNGGVAAASSGLKRKSSMVGVSALKVGLVPVHKKAKPSAVVVDKVKPPVVTVEAFIQGMHDVYRETDMMPLTDAVLSDIYHKYIHPMTKRSWTAGEIRQCTHYLTELGFTVSNPVELNQMLPEGAVTKSGQPVEQANLFVWRNCGQQLGINMDLLYTTLEATEFDKLKWSRRAKPGTNGKQNKLARHNGCYTDLKEVPLVQPDDGDVTEDFVRHKHPKNHEIKFTNFAFRGELKKFRSRFAAVLGPFGYKFAEQFAELNKYYDKGRGIGRHGDVERGLGSDAGAVNCLKVGYYIPMLFSWYKSTKPTGRTEPMGPVSVTDASFPIVTFGKKKWMTQTMAAAVTLGHGDFYMMSEKAIGKDWKKHDYALRHCAGARKYTCLPKTYYEAVEHSLNGEFDSAYSLTFSDCVENDSETPELQFCTKYA